MNSVLISFMAGFILVSGEAGPSDKMYEELRTAPSVIIAESLEDDIVSALMESGSATADILLERALAAERAENLELARELLDRAVMVEPDFPEAWYRRALLYLNDEAYDQALLDLNEALSIEPRHFRAWMILGRVFEVLGQNREALEAYREVLTIHPHYEAALAEVRRLSPKLDGRAI